MKKVKVEELTIDHASLLFDLMRDERMFRYISDKMYSTVEELKQRYEILVRGPKPGKDEIWLNWVMSDDSSGEPVGTLQATIIPTKKLAYVAYVVFPPYWKSGYGTAGLTWLLEYLSARDDVTHAEAYIDQRNMGSQKLISKFSFSLKETIATGDGTFDFVYQRSIP